jgi:hypothetical protein
LFDEIQRGITQCPESIEDRTLVPMAMVMAEYGIGRRTTRSKVPAPPCRSQSSHWQQWRVRKISPRCRRYTLSCIIPYCRPVAGRAPNPFRRSVPHSA